uniref:HYR domain-containing protein n=1 Tax=Capitella teleta TaxID=283909 RepID=X2AU42_CAPTE
MYGAHTLRDILFTRSSQIFSDEAGEACSFRTFYIVDSSTDGLFIATVNHILFDNGGSEPPVSVYNNSYGRIVGLAYDHSESLLFWSDIDASAKGIFRASVGSGGSLSDIRHIVSDDVDEVNGLSVDFVSKHVYWTDAGKRSIELSDYEGTNRRVLNIQGLFIPRGILVDPIQMWVYWNDQGSGVIGKCRPDGSDLSYFDLDDIEWPNQMAWDAANSQLYFVDSKPKALKYYKNDEVTTVVTFDQIDGNNIFGLALHNGYAYVSVWNSGQVLKVDLSSAAVTVERNALSKAKAMFSLLYWTAQTTRPSNNEKRCSCPSFGGKVLYNNNQCREPINILLYTSADLGEVAYFTNDPNYDTTDRYLVARSLRPVAVHYNPVTKTVFWSDVTERTIRKAKLDGSDSEILLSFNHSIGVVDGVLLVAMVTILMLSITVGLVVDPKHNLLYYSNMGFVEVDGASYAWHKIEGVSLSDIEERRVIIDSVERPRGLTLTEDKLVYTDWGSQASVSSAEKNGSQSTVLQSGLDNPNGVYVIGSDIFLVDSHDKARRADTPADTDLGSLYLFNANGGSDTQLLNNANLKVPFGITGNEYTLYVSDWGHNAILELKINSSSKEVMGSKILISEVPSPMGLVYSKVSETVSPSCLANSCGENQVCLPVGNSPSCACNSYDQRVNMPGGSCSIPPNFLLFGDMNGIRMVGIGTEDTSIQTIFEGGPYFSNYAGLVYHKDENSIYFSDVNEKAIFKYDMGTMQSSVFYEPNNSPVMDSLLIVNNRLYWSDYLGGNIASISLTDVSDIRVEISNLRQPRGLQYHDGSLYWTEWGDGARVAKAAPGRSTTTTLVSNGLEWPNALYLDTDNDMMYIGDGKTKTFTKCNLNGEDCNKLNNLDVTPEHIYAMSVIYPYLYYSDWNRGSITVVHLVSGTSKSVPVTMDVVMIVWLFRVRLPAHVHLVKFSSQMEKHARTWVKEDPSRCNVECGTNAECAHLTGTSTYECQCKAGYSGSSCQACGSNTFKWTLGPDGCESCPLGSVSTGEGQTQCQCPTNKYWNWQTKKCSDNATNKPGECPTSSLLRLECSSLNTCTDDGGCRAAKRCCGYSDCGDKCLDPVGLDVCVFDGAVYGIGEVFRPDHCTQCQCTDDKSRGDPRFGGAECEIKTCPILECVADMQILPPGECCKICDITGQALKFLNCPTEPITINLAADQRFYNNEITSILQVIDRRNLKREIAFEQKPIENIVHFNGNDQRHRVDVTASAINIDGEVDTVVCTYYIIVKDYQIPSLTCPENQVAVTKTGSAYGTWPRPRVTDNVRVASLDAKPKYFSLLNVGNHTIRYTAMDTAGNAADCTFEYVVMEQAIKECPAIPNIQNGAFDCNSDGGNNVCTRVCSSGFTLSSVVERTHTCSDGVWSPSFETSSAVGSSCLRQTPFKLRSHLLVKYNGCTPSTKLDYTKALLEDRLRSYLEHEPGIEGSATVSGCGQNINGKRDANTMNIEIILFAQYTSDSERDRNTQTMDAILNEIKSDIETGRFKLVVSDDGDGGQSIDRSDLAVTPVGDVEIGVCKPGELTTAIGCLKCPAGTMQRGNQCQNCPSATYQHSEAQTECLFCPEDLRGETQEGRFDESQCKVSADPPLLIIIIVVVVVVILLIIIIAVTVVCCKKRQSKEEPRVNKCGMDGAKIAVPNKAFDKSDDDVYAEIDEMGELPGDDINRQNDGVSDEQSNGKLPITLLYILISSSIGGLIILLTSILVCACACRRRRKGTHLISGDTTADILRIDNPGYDGEYSEIPADFIEKPDVQHPFLGKPNSAATEVESNRGEQFPHLQKVDPAAVEAAGNEYEGLPTPPPATNDYPKGK